MHHRRPLAALALAAALALPLSACGSSDGGSSALTKEAFIKQGDAICKSANEATDKLFDEFDPSTGDTLEFYKELAATSLESVKSVRALGIPKDDADELAPHFDTIEEGFQAIVDDPAKAEEMMAEEDSELDAASDAITDYGFKECGS